MPRQLQLTESLNQKLEIIREARKAYKQAMKDNARAIMQEMAADIMAAHPGVTSIRWAQYTPYFNDGDACRFGVYEPKFSFSESFLNSITELGYEDSICEMSDNFYTVYSHRRNVPEFLKTLAQKQRAFYALLEELEEAMEEGFGDHSQITILANGNILVERYDHD